MKQVGVGDVTLVVDDGRVRGSPGGRRDRIHHALPPGGRRHPTADVAPHNKFEAVKKTDDRARTTSMCSSEFSFGTPSVFLTQPEGHELPARSVVEN